VVTGEAHLVLKCERVQFSPLGMSLSARRFAPRPISPSFGWATLPWVEVVGEEEREPQVEKISIVVPAWDLLQWGV